MQGLREQITVIIEKGGEIMGSQKTPCARWKTMVAAAIGTAGSSERSRGLIQREPDEPESTEQKGKLNKQ